MSAAIDPEIDIDEALYRLLHHKSFRTAFLAGADLGLTSEIADALSAMDREQLERAADRIVDDLSRRKHRGCGDLLTIYARTLAALPAGTDQRALFQSFLESPWFDRFREVPFAGEGIAVEEAFCRFLREQPGVDLAAAEQEFLSGMCRAIALAPSPAFTIPAELIKRRGGWAAVRRTTGGSVFLHAVAKGAVVEGEITEFLAALATATAAQTPAEIARDHRIPAAVAAAATEQLARLGLLA